MKAAPAKDHSRLKTEIKLGIVRQVAETIARFGDDPPQALLADGIAMHQDPDDWIGENVFQPWLFT